VRTSLNRKTGGCRTLWRLLRQDGHFDFNLEVRRFAGSPLLVRFARSGSTPMPDRTTSIQPSIIVSFSIFRWQVLLVCVDGNMLVLNFQSQAVVNAHVLVGNPHQREKRNQISAPIRKQEFETGNQQKQGCDIVAEAVFAGEDVKELTSHKPATVLLRLAELLQFTKNCFMSHGPRRRSNRYCQKK